jgi:hypothetical protein
MTYNPERLNSVGGRVVSFPASPTPPGFMIAEDGSIVPIPSAVRPEKPYEEQVEEIPTPKQSNREPEDDYSDVTGLSDDDEDELFGIEGEDDPTNSDDDFADVLELSEKANDDLFGTGDSYERRKKTPKKPFRRYTPPAGGIGGVRG